MRLDELERELEAYVLEQATKLRRARRELQALWAEEGPQLALRASSALQASDWVVSGAEKAVKSLESIMEMPRIEAGRLLGLGFVRLMRWFLARSGVFAWNLSG